MRGTFGGAAEMHEKGYGPLIVVIGLILAVVIFWYVDRGGRN